ncbi:DoxX family protein [Corynebacterium lizhenjunii]|uniref:DoxX family protein n=1 Tax=Corynebacterium lizhenjunii TaxID=2709394 RepID=UPI0013E9B45E|nr:DoxX family membrane protein [Corynebacterium lizhenjunii]
MIRKFARPVLASVFVWDGVDTLRNTKDHVSETESVLATLRKVIPAPYSSYIPRDPELVTKAFAGAKVGSGSLFALGKAPRTSAAVLALTHLPTVVGRNAFWSAEDKEAKDEQRNGFITNAALLGALAILTQDTEGNPSLRWRAQDVSKRTSKKVAAALPTKSETEKFADNVSSRAQELSSQAQGWLSETTDKAQAYVEDNRGDWEKAGRNLLDTAKSYVEDAREAVEDFIEDNADDWRKQGQDFLKKAEKNSKVARKSLVKNASKAQKRADKALEEVTDSRNAKKAAAKAEKLQKQADKAVSKALKKFGDKI